MRKTKILFLILYKHAYIDLIRFLLKVLLYYLSIYLLLLFSIIYIFGYTYILL